MMAQGHRLGRLEMGVSGHDCVRGGLRLVEKGCLQLGQLAVQKVDFIAQEKAQIRHRLVVAGARRVQPPRHRADQVAQAAFDVHVNVFERTLEFEPSGHDLLMNAVETGNNGCGVRFGYDALLGEHAAVHLGACDVLGEKLPVEVDRGVDLLHGFGRAGGETSAPHAVGARRAGGGRRTVLGGILVRLLGGHVGHFRQLALRVVT